MARDKKKVEERKVVFTTKMLEEITEKINDGIVLKKFQNPWFKNEVGIRRGAITFFMTEEEIEEYTKCKLDLHYFAEKYCKVKTEDGSIQNITLRDYQKKILDLYHNNRFSILCASRQTGKCLSFNSLVDVENQGIYRVGILYYQILSTIRPLTFLEKIKIKLYDFIFQMGG